VLTAPRPQAGPCAWLGRLGAHAATPTLKARADAGGKGGVRGATLTGAPRAVPGGHVLGVAVGDRVELRQLQRQVQVQARVVGEARLARAGAPPVIMFCSLGAPRLCAPAAWAHFRRGATRPAVDPDRMRHSGSRARLMPRSSRVPPMSFTSFNRPEAAHQARTDCSRGLEQG